MNKLVLVLGLTCLWAGAFAQEPRWTVSILPGYQFNTTTYQLDRSSWYRRTGETQANSVGSMDWSVRLTDRFGLHFAYLINGGRYTERQYSYYGHLYTTDYTAPIQILEIGPEWTICPSGNTTIYFQLNMGRTISSESASYGRYYGYYRQDAIRDNTWTIGAAAGIRYYFLKNAGITGQVAFHHLSAWVAPDLWDVRLGATFRF
jgi:hypothetical protein